MGKTIYLTDEEINFIGAKTNDVDSDDKEFDKRMYKLNDKMMSAQSK